MTEEEKKLVELLKKRDEQAFDRFFRQHQHKIFRLALRFLGNLEEAEDVTQDIFITVFKQIDTFHGESSISTWLYRIAVNHCKNRIKYLSRRPALHIEGKATEFEGEMSGAGHENGYAHRLPGPDEVLEFKETEKLVMNVISGLDEDLRTILILREMESLSYEEIAEVLNIEMGTVKSRLSRARSIFYDRFKNFVSQKGRR